MGSIPANGQTFSTPTSAATSTTTSTSSLITETSLITASSTSAASSQQSTGLTTGAQVGIGVGIAVGALLLIATGFFWYRRAAKEKHQQIATEFDGQKGTNNFGYPGGQQAEPQMLQYNKQLAQSPTYELGDHQQQHELGSDRQRYEMSGV